MTAMRSDGMRWNWTVFTHLSPLPPRCSPKPSQKLRRSTRDCTAGLPVHEAPRPGTVRRHRPDLPGATSAECRVARTGTVAGGLEEVGPTGDEPTHAHLKGQWSKRCKMVASLKARREAQSPWVWERKRKWVMLIIYPESQFVPPKMGTRWYKYLFS